jgi:predicted metalloprotease with PDZ domain
LVKGLPKGQPEPGDRGLDRTHTWGRTYWGGALFAFVADLEIRKATDNRQSLMTALRGALAAGAEASVQWPVEKFLTACDQATGTTVLIDLYRRMATRPVNVDLQAIWRELGVTLSADRINLDPRAPLAAIRRSMIGREDP